jgi:predicted acylesterase/phospholipase RssA
MRNRTRYGVTDPMNGQHALVLSSGFLAFARHIGVARAYAAHGLAPVRLSGVSSGALIGALWAAGASPDEMLRFVLDGGPPWHSLRPRVPFGGTGPGLLSLDAFVARIAAVLPGRIEDLPLPFSAGVVRRADGACLLIDRGPIAEVVAASCAMPWIFGPRRVEAAPCVDGGARDRIFLRTLLERHPIEAAVVHLVSSSMAGRKTRGDVVEAQLAWAAARGPLTVIRTPRSGASFLSLGDVEGQAATADRLARVALAAAP